MLIEIHMIQNHSPATLNRDDMGAPKTCVFGGVTRARISSQCLKRSIRRSGAFSAAIESDGGVRTRRLITTLAQRADGTDDPPREFVDFVAGIFEKGGVKRVDKKGADEPDNTNILLFVPESAIAEMVQAVMDESSRSAAAQAALAECFAEVLGQAACVPDIALSGRMLELDKKGLFAKLDMHVDAALSAAHAISTHEVTNEVDYWSAVDDLGRGPAAGHVDEAQFTSACFYKYFCLDWKQLVDNLAGPEPKAPKKTAKKEEHEAYQKAMQAYPQARRDAERFAACTLGHFLIAAARTSPSGKQNSFASHCEPCGILVEVKRTKTPTSYANAFAEPVVRIGTPDDDAADEKSIEGRSVACLADHVHSLRRAYGSGSTLLWYSPKLWRFPLQYWEREEDGKKRSSKPLTDERFDALGGGSGDANGLVEALIKALKVSDGQGNTLTWEFVKDQGKAQPEEGN